MFVYFNFRMSSQDETSINTISYHLLQRIPLFDFFLLFKGECIHKSRNK